MAAAHQDKHAINNVDVMHAESIGIIECTPAFRFQFALTPPVFQRPCDRHGIAVLAIASALAFGIIWSVERFAKRGVRRHDWRAWFGWRK
jgi:hypothetical protein